MDYKQLAKVFKALSHPNRLELFNEILKKSEASFEESCSECLISDIKTSLNIGAPTISHHLKELMNADLIETERKGKFLIAKVNRYTMQHMKEFFDTKT